jgi:GUN4-like
MGRSLTASVKGLIIAKSAFGRKYTSQKICADIVGCSRQVVGQFFRREPVQAELFQSICSELDLPWEEIADLSTDIQQPVQDVVFDALVQEVPAIPKQQEPQPMTDKNALDSIDNVILASEQGVDYRTLRDLLKAGEWKEADQEMLKAMMKAAKREGQGWLDANSLKEFPCQDLKTIDHLWVTASNGHFGISVQTKIWGECGSPIAYSDTWKLFCDRVGWYKKGNPLKFSDLKFSLGYSQKGELPSWIWSEENAGDLISGEVFFARAKACEL